MHCKGADTRLHASSMKQKTSSFIAKQPSIQACRAHLTIMHFPAIIRCCFLFFQFGNRALLLSVVKEVVLDSVAIKTIKRWMETYDFRLLLVLLLLQNLLKELIRNNLCWPPLFTFGFSLPREQSLLRSRRVGSPKSWESTTSTTFFALFAIRYSGIFAVRYSLLFAIRVFQTPFIVAKLKLNSLSLNINIRYR